MAGGTKIAKKAVNRPRASRRLLKRALSARAHSLFRIDNFVMALRFTPHSQMKVTMPPLKAHSDMTMGTSLRAGSLPS